LVEHPLLTTNPEAPHVERAAQFIFPERARSAFPWFESYQAASASL
jgi:hypothetical protein